MCTRARYSLYKHVAQTLEFFTLQVEFEDSIIEDLALLGIQADKASHTSDYFDELYRLVIELVKKGMAYADDTEQMEVRSTLAKHRSSMISSNSL